MYIVMYIMLWLTLWIVLPGCERRVPEAASTVASHTAAQPDNTGDPAIPLLPEEQSLET
jgi:hypothetical protein